MDKEDVRQLNEILLTHKKEQTKFAATWMEPWMELSEVKSERERQIPYDITYIWNLIYSTNEHFHRKENHGLGEQTCGCPGEGGGTGLIGELGLTDANLLLEWIYNEILLCSIENYVWIRTSQHNNGRKKYVYMYVQLGHHAVQWKINKQTENKIMANKGKRLEKDKLGV